MCGEVALMIKQGEFRFDPPPNIPGGVFVVQNATWRECDACHEQIIPHELDQALDREHERRQKTLVPNEVRRAPDKAGLSVSAG